MLDHLTPDQLQALAQYHRAYAAWRCVDAPVLADTYSASVDACHRVGLDPFDYPAPIPEQNSPTPLSFPSEELIQVLERIADSLEALNDKHGAIANSLMQLSDVHGSKTPGPF